MDEDERVPRVPKELTIRIKPTHFLGLARDALTQGNGITAIQNYIGYITNLSDPDEMLVQEQMNLTRLIIDLNSNSKETDGLHEEIIKCYLSVLNVYPQNVILSNAFGVFLFKQGEYHAARKFLKIAAEAEYLPGEKNYLHVIWHLVARWHFRMLNDKHRNECYKKAITEAVNSGLKNVYDIGCGAGLLSLLALAADKDVKVVAFEENKAMSEVAKKVFELNNVSERVHLITGNSTKHDTGPAPCDLIVTEIFDAGVFGEECLDSIVHALNHFCTGSHFKIIPTGVKVFVTGFQSLNLAKKFRLLESLPELGLQGSECIVDGDDEPYDAEFLRSQKDLRFLTKTAEFLSVNFYDVTRLAQLLSQKDCISQIELLCTSEGTVSSLAVWFDLYLNSEILISTDPDNNSNQCWEQAVFNLIHPINVTAGDVLTLKPQIVDGRLNFEVLSPKSDCATCLRVSKDTIAFLNDTELMKAIKQAADSYENCDNLKVVDFNIFPVFGLLLAKKGATVVSVYRDENDLSLLRHLVNVNKLPHQKTIFVYEKTMNNYMVYMEPPDVVFRDVIQSHSWHREHPFKQDLLECVVLPKKISLKVQLVSFGYLDFCNKVDDANTFGFKMAEAINVYTGTEHPNFDQIIPEGLCSNIASIDISSDPDRMDFHAEVTVAKDAVCNGFLYWFEAQITDDESTTFDTLKSRCYENCCAILKTPKCVSENDVVMIHVMRYDGHLKVYCDD